MKKSFTLVEIIVTITILILLVTINFGIFYVYQGRSVVERGINELRDTILKTQNLAYSSSDPYANHYIFYLNTNPTQSITPFFQSQAKDEICKSLAANGGWCIMREVNNAGLVPFVAGPYPCGPGKAYSCLASGVERRGVSRGQLNLGNGSITATPASTWQKSPEACPNGDCGKILYCDHLYLNGEGQQENFCQNINEVGLMKISFRTWDGKIGISGDYNDTTKSGYNPGEEAHYTISAGGQAKTLYINLFTGSIHIGS